MTELPFAIKLLISLILGAVIGLERESHDIKKNDERPHSVGVRSFALITTLGTLAGFFIDKHFSVFLLISITFMVLSLAYYISNAIHTKDIGITTELALIFSYLIGLFISLEVIPMQLIIAMTIVLILILARKQDIRNIVGGIHREELQAVISFALIALVVLPFLPKESFSLGDIPGLSSILAVLGINNENILTTEIISPFKLWTIVALITGVDVAGYVLEKTIGKGHGRIVASMVGGLISSTATTQSLAQESKNSNATNRLVAAALLANFMSFFPIIFLIGSIDVNFLLETLPTLLLIIISALVVSLFFLFQKSPKDVEAEKKKDEKIEESQIFALKPALKFALIFLAIRIFSQISLELFGESGFLATSAISAFTGIDAPTINIASLAGDKISTQVGIVAFILVNSVNLLAKSFYSFIQGKKEFALKFTLSSLIIIAASLAGLLFV